MFYISRAAASCNILFSFSIAGDARRVPLVLLQPTSGRFGLPLLWSWLVLRLGCRAPNALFSLYDYIYLSMAHLAALLLCLHRHPPFAPETLLTFQQLARTSVSSDHVSSCCAWYESLHRFSLLCAIFSGLRYSSHSGHPHFSI